jgi:hypothetical protein
MRTLLRAFALTLLLTAALLAQNSSLNGTAADPAGAANPKTSETLGNQPAGVLTSNYRVYETRTGLAQIVPMHMNSEDVSWNSKGVIR